MDLFIPSEFYKVKELNNTERVVLAIYRHYTFKSDEHCCTLTKKQIAEDLCISVDYMKKIKKHLKELGYIKTDGMNVTYLKEKLNDDGIDKWFCEV